MTRSQQSQPQVLGHVGVLILVHQNELKPTLILLQNIGVVLENCHHVQQKIAKIGGIQFTQTVLIERIQLNTLVIIRATVSRWYLIWGQRTVLPAVNHIGQSAGGPAFVVNPSGTDQLL